MNLAARRRQPMTVADFIAMIRPYPDEERWELLDGEPVLMSPQSERHQTIVMNLLRTLDPAARGKGCKVLPGLGILNDEIDTYAPIPDVIVRCGPPLPDGYARDPVLIAEVLSPSTRNNDRGRKADFYETLASLRTFLVVHQDQSLVEAWQRDAEGAWVVRAYGPGEAITLTELELTLPVAALYADVLSA
ncbi:MAG TPA: Uma2 family endonuclease [Beijerinckiaceae bacterium]|jgi:Uma2 family endonuclease